MKQSTSNHILVKLFILCVALVTLISVQTSSSIKASNPVQASDYIHTPGPEIVILAGDYAGPFYVPPPQNLTPRAPSAVTINVTYVGAWTVDAQAAFQAAIDVWAGLLTLPSTPPVSIDVEANWTSLAAGTLGSAGAYAYWSGGSLPAGISYPDALADAIAGIDIGPLVNAADPDNTYEIIANFNSDYPNWYTGTDGNPGAGEYDLMTVVLHELGHGVGFAGSAGYSAGDGSFSATPFIYDCFTADGANINLLDAGTYANPSVALGSAFTGDDIHFGGPNTVAASASTTNNAKLYAPAIWNGGSSYSHLDDTTYDGTAHALMTHALGLGEAVHSPGSITMGLLTDIGWNGGAIPPTGACPSTPTAITLQTVNADSPDSGVGMFLLLVVVALLLVLTGGLQHLRRRRVVAS